MAAAAKLEYPRFKELRALYRISVGKDHIICKRKTLTLVELPSARYDEAIELLDILELYIANKTMTLNFPNASQIDDDLIEWLVDQEIAHSWNDGSGLTINPLSTLAQLTKVTEMEEKDVL